MPLLLSTGVRNTAPNVLFSSLFTSDITSAPALHARQLLPHQAHALETVL